MREVLNGMEDFSSSFAFRPSPGCFQILSVESPADEIDRHFTPHQATVLQHPRARKVA